VKKLDASVQAESSTKGMDDTIVCGVIIDLTSIGVMDKTSEASNAAMVDEVEPYWNSDTGDRCRTGCHDITLQNMQIRCVRMNRLNK